MARVSIESEGKFGDTKVMINGKQLGSGKTKLVGFMLVGEGPMEESEEGYFTFRATLAEQKGEDEWETRSMRISNSKEHGLEIIDEEAPNVEETAKEEDSEDNEEDKQTEEGNQEDNEETVVRSETERHLGIS